MTPGFRRLTAYIDGELRDLVPRDHCELVELTAWSDRYWREHEREARAAETKGRVYFVATLTGDRVKIGYSKHVDQRMKQLQAATHQPLVLLTSSPAPGKRRSERALHRLFAAHALGNEWFRPAPELLSFVRQLQPATDEQRALAIVNATWETWK